MCGQMDRQLIGRQTGRRWWWWWWWDGESLLSVTVICDSFISSSYVLRLNRNKSDRMNLCRQGRFFSSGRFAFSIWAGRNNWPYLDKDSKLLIQQEVSLSVMMLELRVFKEQIHTCSVVHLLSEITAAAGVISICHHEIQQEVLKCPDCPQKVPVRSTGGRVLCSGDFGWIITLIYLHSVSVSAIKPFKTVLIRPLDELQTAVNELPDG